MKKRFCIIVISLATVIIAPFSISAAHSQVIGDAWKLCDFQTQKEEKKNGIPRYLLKYITKKTTTPTSRNSHTCQSECFQVHLIHDSFQIPAHSHLLARF